MKHLIGYTPLGEKVYVEVALRERDEGLELSIVGEVHASPAERRSNAIARRDPVIACGQIIDDVANPGLRLVDSWAEKRGRLVEIWMRWHLNSLRAGCEHQRAAGLTHVGDASVIGRPCPTCGYKYGTAWVFEPLPDDVLEFVRPLASVDK